VSDGTREQLFLVTLTIDGVDIGIWDKWDGGGKDSTSTKYRSGGNPNEEDLGGLPTFTDVTLTRNYRLSRDAAIVGFLLNKVGFGTCIANKFPLNRDYSTYGPYIQAIGPLKTVDDPKVDSNAANAATLIVVLSVNSINSYSS
jgi:hypothetical protein